MAHGSRPAHIDPEVKGQGHMVIKCTAGLGMQVDMAAHVSSLDLFFNILFL